MWDDVRWNEDQEKRQENEHAQEQFHVENNQSPAQCPSGNDRRKQLQKDKMR